MSEKINKNEESISMSSIGTPSLETSNSGIKLDQIPTVDDIMNLVKDNSNQEEVDAMSHEEVFDEIDTDFDTGDTEVIGQVPDEASIFGEEISDIDTEEEIEEDIDDEEIEEDQYPIRTRYFKANDIIKLLDECKKSGKSTTTRLKNKWLEKSKVS